MDLRSTIAAVVRLPFDADRLVDILCETETAAAASPSDEDHSKFWLITADQFAKRGIVCDRVRRKALEIIDGGSDLAMLEKLGMPAGDLRKRRKILEELRERITAEPVDRPRTTLKTPQPLLLERGDVIVYPTCAGKCINPYYASKELDKHYRRLGPVPWRQDGWGAAVIIDCGRVFDFLSWYRPLTLARAMAEKPLVESLRGDIWWRLELPGTCSPAHFKKMELEKIGKLPVDPEKVQTVFPGLRPGLSAAVSDISIANRLSAATVIDFRMLAKPGEPSKGRSRTIQGIEQLLIEK